MTHAIRTLTVLDLLPSEVAEDEDNYYVATTCTAVIRKQDLPALLALARDADRRRARPLLNPNGEVTVEQAYWLASESDDISAYEALTWTTPGHLTRYFDQPIPAHDMRRTEEVPSQK